MRNKLSKLLMLVGTVFVVAALALFLFNRLEAMRAEKASNELLAQLVEDLEGAGNPTVPMGYMDVPLERLDPSAFEMKEVEIDGHTYIGYLSIPSLKLKLPIMSDWTYDKLRIAPCRYYGSVLGQNLVLMAHNYPKHFGKIANLNVGDTVIFTDMHGVDTEYEVVGQDILRPDAVEEMTAGDFDLTLFTCNYSGASRVTVYCDRVKN